MKIRAIRSFVMASVTLFATFFAGDRMYEIASSGFFTDTFATSTEQLPPVHFINPSQELRKGEYAVVRVIDGDTIEVSHEPNIKEKVRLIGINAPESVDPRRPVQCFGKEASDYLKDLLHNKTVYLKLDTSQQVYDKYGRLLAYVYDNNDVFINKKLIEDGYAYEYTYQTPYAFQKEFKNAQSVAKENHIGLWSVNTCNGEKTSALQ